MPSEQRFQIAPPLRGYGVELQRRQRLWALHSIHRATFESVAMTSGTSTILSITASMEAMSSPSTMAMASGVPRSASALTTPGILRIACTTLRGCLVVMKT